MELTIDSKPCDLAGEPIAVGGYAAAELADVEAAREGRSQELTLPATPRNEALLGFARDPHTAGRFNASLHRAVLSAEGAKLLAGTVRLLEASGEGYRIEIREGGARWAKMPPGGCSAPWASIIMRACSRRPSRTAGRTIRP